MYDSTNLVSYDRHSPELSSNNNSEPYHQNQEFICNKTKFQTILKLLWKILLQNSAWKRLEFAWCPDPIEQWFSTRCQGTLVCREILWRVPQEVWRDKVWGDKQIKAGLGFPSVTAPKLPAPLQGGKPCNIINSFLKCGIIQFTKAMEDCLESEKGVPCI